MRHAFQTCVALFTQTFKHAITHTLTFKHAIQTFKHAKLLKLHFKYSIPSNTVQHTLARKAPGGGRIKHLVPPCISGMQLFEAEHVSIRADSMHQLLPKRQQIGPLAHPKPSNTLPVDTHHSHRSFSQEGRLIYFSTSLL